MTDDDSYQLAARLAGYAASTALQEQPQMRRDLLSASRQIADFHDLLNAWAAAFAQRDIGQEFAEILGTAGMNEAWKRRLQFKVIIQEIPDTS
jgi:UDP-N-acetylmuramate-alanine ligase